MHDEIIVFDVRKLSTSRGGEATGSERKFRQDEIGVRAVTHRAKLPALSARRTRSPAGGRSAALARALRGISGPRIDRHAALTENRNEDIDQLFLDLANHCFVELPATPPGVSVPQEE
jgi:hypothetical protein